ncbi:pilus assembly protein PilP [Undibacterium sp. TC4M20W]|uniref:pilus assembly protein PilP n=1 Tax=unclassified Undibacterium TaxID=2630295 RepID=UPI003BF208D3
MEQRERREITSCSDGKSKTMQMPKKLAVTLILLLVCISSFATLTLGVLEKYEYGDLALVGTGMDGRGWIACFKNIKGERFIAIKGDHIGKVFGSIAEINSKGIFIAETINLNFEDWYERKFFWPVVSNESMRSVCKR